MTRKRDAGAPAPAAPPRASASELLRSGWFTDQLGLPPTAGVCITSGNTMSACIALKAARDAKAGWAIGELGNRAGPPLTLYASSRARDVNERAADILGLGREALRAVRCDDSLCMRTDLLAAAIEHDLRTGHEPIAVIATVGIVSAGPIDEIAAIAARYDLWLHVDATHAGIAAITGESRSLYRGIQRADSIAVHPGNLLHARHSEGVLVLRRPAALRNGCDPGVSLGDSPPQVLRRRKTQG